MVSRLVRIVPSLLVVAFSFAAFIFSLLAATSREWAVRNNYDPRLTQEHWKNPIFTLYRSPFVICSANLVPTTADPNPNPAISTSYNVTCRNFSPYGFGKTSCELAIATHNNLAVNTGDGRMCQQIHWSGYNIIASASLLGAAMLLSLILTFFALIAVSKGETSEDEHNGAAPAAEERSDKPEGSSVVYGKFRVPHLSTLLRLAVTSGATSIFNLLLISLLASGATTAIISQLYGIEGLIQSAPNNADFASSFGPNSAPEVRADGDHGPWFQGKALTIYATLAWTLAAAAALLATCTWRLPKWDLLP